MAVVEEGMFCTLNLPRDAQSTCTLHMKVDYFCVQRTS